ncbi:tRNA (adenine(58)-N(1))-methyltransferase non-catalytic subunit TRM6-like [Liolophura sinensis]|uniref:tRNA (adenine(58)-N(1))-methyltransferase non-catalytic subunit TRM6-like n=1 Tax=Liolophura sinensis TaxID=3198878 RepID=UPI003158CD5A
MALIQEGDKILLKKDNHLKLFEIRRNRPVAVEKVKFTLDAAIGQPYGTLFEVKDKGLVKVLRADYADDAPVEGERGDDNRELLDRDSNQKLSHDEIAQMKEEGVRGESIVEHLIENSATFKTKTEFAQEKYVQKKKKKHLPVYTILKPTTRLLCEMYLSRSANKIGYLRMDSLSQILTYGNVQAGSTIAVVDSCLGLVLGAVMERMMGHGKVIHLYPGTQPNRPALDAYGFPDHVLKSLIDFPLPYVKDLYTDDRAPNWEFEAESCDDGERAESDKDNRKRKHEDQWNKKSRKEQQLREARNAMKGKVDGLIVAFNQDPLPVVSYLSPFIHPSRPVVVFSQFKEPLMDTYVQMREKNVGVNFRVTETWLREYQVLPERTHPMVKMSAGGGYLLTYTTVIPS